MKDISVNLPHSSDADPNTPRVALILSVAATLLLSVAMGVSAIIIPTTLQSYGISSTVIGLIMSLETIAAFVISLFFPSLLRVIGLKYGLVFSTLLRIPSLLLLGFTSNIFLWTIAVFFNGVGCFTFLILLQTWIVGMKFKSNKGLLVSLYTTSISLGLALGPLLLEYSGKILLFVKPLLNTYFINIAFSSVVVPHVPNTRFIFILAALMSLVALLPILMGFFLLPSFKLKGNVGIWQSIINAKGPMFAVTMAGVSFFGVCAFITIYGLKNQLSFNESALLLTLFMMGSLLLEAPLTWASDFIDRRYIIVIAAFMSMLCAVYLPIAIYVNYQAYILLFIWGGVNAAIYSTSLALIGDKYEGDALVAANAGYTLMDAAGGTAGILLIGYTMEAFGSDGLPYVIMLSSILYFSFALTRYRVV
jgi:MFS family permease